MLVDISPELTSRLRLSIARLSRRLRQQAAEGITSSQLSALATVEKHGPITLGDLATHERVQPPTITRIVAGLEEPGFVQRRSDPTDRRVVLVSITPVGQRFLDRSRNRKNAYLAKRLRRLTPEELATVEAALPLLERLVEE
jgi:DNA-binding MarR family transcriptional regulator